jgi:hypothetical protein
MRYALTFLPFTFLIAMADDLKPVTIQTPSGEITFKEKTIPDQKEFKDTVTELTPDEQAALKQDAERALVFVSVFVACQKRTGDILEDLDSAFTAWLTSGKRDAYTDRYVIRIVGAALGAHAVKNLGVRWARVTDEYGSVMALVADAPPTRSFPFTSIEYRIEDKKTDFIVALYRTLEHSMKDASK